MYPLERSGSRSEKASAGDTGGTLGDRLSPGPRGQQREEHGELPVGDAA